MNNHLITFSNSRIFTIIKNIGYFTKIKISTVLVAISLSLIGSITCFALGDNPPNSVNPSNPQNPTQTIYEIFNVDDLKDLSKQGETFEGKTIILKNNINIISNKEVNGEAIKFNPLFSEGMEFKGTFDGNNKILNCSVTNGRVIGYMSNDETVKNLKVTGYFTGDIDEAIFCCNKGNIENISIDATIKADLTSVSAICGVNEGIINNCEARGNISTSDINCASISFANNDKIINCKVFAKLNNCVKNIHPNNEFYGSAGSLVSTNNGVIEKSIFKGTVATSFTGIICSTNYTIIKSCNINATVKGNSASEFVHDNVWGDIDFA